MSVGESFDFHHLGNRSKEAALYSSEVYIEWIDRVSVVCMIGQTQFCRTDIGLLPIIVWDLLRESSADIVEFVSESGAWQDVVWGPKMQLSKSASTKINGGGTALAARYLGDRNSAHQFDALKNSITATFGIPLSTGATMYNSTHSGDTKPFAVPMRAFPPKSAPNNSNRQASSQAVYRIQSYPFKRFNPDTWKHWRRALMPCRGLAGLTSLVRAGQLHAARWSSIQLSIQRTSISTSSSSSSSSTATATTRSGGDSTIKQTSFQDIRATVTLRVLEELPYDITATSATTTAMDDSLLFQQLQRQQKLASMNKQIGSAGEISQRPTHCPLVRNNTTTTTTTTTTTAAAAAAAAATTITITTTPADYSHICSGTRGFVVKRQLFDSRAMTFTVRTEIRRSTDIDPSCPAVTAVRSAIKLELLFTEVLGDDYDINLQSYQYRYYNDLSSSRSTTLTNIDSTNSTNSTDNPDNPDNTCDASTSGTVQSSGEPKGNIRSENYSNSNQNNSEDINNNTILTDNNSTADRVDSCAIPTGYITELADFQMHRPPPNNIYQNQDQDHYSSSSSYHTLSWSLSPSCFSPGATWVAVYQANKRFIPRERLPIDASRGSIVPASVLIVRHTTTTTTTTTNTTNATNNDNNHSNSFSASHTNLHNAVLASMVQSMSGSETEYADELVFTKSFVVVMPIPDPSMPFNVITLVSTVLAFFVGSLVNALMRKKNTRSSSTSTTKKKNEDA